jgi:hypothetical protein
LINVLDRLDAEPAAALEMAGLMWELDGEVGALESIWDELEQEARDRTLAFLAAQVGA